MSVLFFMVGMTSSIEILEEFEQASSVALEIQQTTHTNRYIAVLTLGFHFTRPGAI